MKELSLNKPVLQNKSGLYVDPTTIAESNAKEDTKIKNDIFERYNKRYNANLQAPVPNVRIPYNKILTRALPPEMKGYTESGLIINEIQVDVRELKQMQVMSENVTNEQEVLLIGPFVKPENGIEINPGDRVKLDFKSYREINDDHTAGVIETSYRIPLFKLDGYEYLLLDARDVLFVIPKK